MKQKIGILSLYYNSQNCGGLLQSYALCHVLGKLGYDCEQICFVERNRSSGRKEKIDKVLRNNDIITIAKLGFAKAYYLVIQKRLIREKLEKRIKVFSEFSNCIPHSSEIYYADTISEAINRYSVFIVGSDQVWNWSNYAEISADNVVTTNLLDIYMLKFVPDNISKIAYSASISTPYIPECLREYYKNSISRFQYVSIREKKSLELFSGDEKKKINVTLDPTLLLTKEEWQNAFCISTDKIEKGFAFVYMLGPSDKDLRVAKMIAANLGLRVIYYHVNLRKSVKEIPRNCIDYDMGPKEFINYISNASLVITNSFHATIFSLNFHTPFYVLERKNKHSMHSRIESVADDFLVKDRIIASNNILKDIKLDGIDWASIDAILEKKRKESFEFLENALSC